MFFSHGVWTGSFWVLQAGGVKARREVKLSRSAFPGEAGAGAGVQCTALGSAAEPAMRITRLISSEVTVLPSVSEITSVI